MKGVGEELEEGDLAEGGGWDALLVHLEPRLLQGDELARHPVPRLVHLPVRPLPNLLDLLVLLHRGRIDDNRSVESIGRERWKLSSPISDRRRLQNLKGWRGGKRSAEGWL